MTIQRGSDGKFSDKISEDICLFLVATFLPMKLQTLSVFETIL